MAVTILTMNANGNRKKKPVGLSPAEIRYKVINELERNKPDIFLLLELSVKPETLILKKTDLLNKYVIASAKQNGSGWTCVFFNCNTIEQPEDENKNLNHIFCNIHDELSGKDITTDSETISRMSPALLQEKGQTNPFLCISYHGAKKKSDPAKSKATQHLDELIHEFQQKYGDIPVILSGDFNHSFSKKFAETLNLAVHTPDSSRAIANTQFLHFLCTKGMVPKIESIDVEKVIGFVMPQTKLTTEDCKTILDHDPFLTGITIPSSEHRHRGNLDCSSYSAYSGYDSDSDGDDLNISQPAHQLEEVLETKFHTQLSLEEEPNADKKYVPPPEDIFKWGAMPLIPPARRDWEGVHPGTLQGVVNTVVWPPGLPEDVLSMTPKEKFDEFRKAAERLDTDSSGKLTSPPDELQDKYNFLVLPGTLSKERKKCTRQMRLHNYNQMRRLCEQKLDESMSRLLLMYQSAFWVRDRSTDGIISQIEGVKLKYK